MNALDQNTSTSLVEIGTAFETVEDLIIELTDLETLVNQMLEQSPQQVYEDVHRSVVVIRTQLGRGQASYLVLQTLSLQTTM